MTEAALLALLASRLCHDLINPIGAIGNGLELLRLAEPGPSPELDLVDQSTRSAAGKLQFFRRAFGDADAGILVPAAQVSALCTGMFTGPRFLVSLDPACTAMTQVDVKSAFLLLLCAEASLPSGGAVEVASGTIRAQGSRVTAASDLWGHLTGVAPATRLLPSQIQFGLAGLHFSEQGLPVAVEFHETGFQIRFGLSGQAEARPLTNRRKLRW